MEERDASHSSLYLLNKKLADLQKVIGIVGYNHDSMINGITTIKNRYFDEMTNILSDYSQIMQNILDELNETRKKSESDVGMEYSKMYDSIQNQGLSIQSNIKQKIESQLIQFDQEISTLKEAIDNINSGLTKQSQFFQENDINTFKSKVRSQIESITTRIDWGDIESRTKYATLLESSQQKFRKLDETFQKSVVDLKKKFFLTSKNSKIVQQIESYKDTCFSLNHLCNDLKLKITHAKKEYEVLMSQYKEKIYSIISEFTNLKKRIADDISTARNNFESENLKLKSIMVQYQNIKISEEERLSSKIKELNQKLSQMRNEIQVEYQEKSQLANGNLADSQKQIDEMKRKFDEEILRLEKENESELNSKIDGFKTIVFVPGKNDVEYFNHFADIQKMHLTEIQMFKDQYNQEIQKENELFEQSTKGIGELSVALCHLRETRENLKKFKENNHQNLIEVDEIAMKHLNDLQTNFLNEKHYLQQKLEEELAQFNSENDLTISQYNEELRLKRFKKISETENQRLAYFDNIKNDFKNDPEIEKLKLEYSKTFQNLIDEFELIDQSNDTKNIITIHQIEEEKEILDDKLNTISKTKLEILKKWQNEINQENSRHQTALLALNSTQECVDIELIQNDHMKLIKEKDLKFQDLNCQLAELQQFKIELNLSGFDSQIDELNEQLKTVRSECDEQILKEEKITQDNLSPLYDKIQYESNLNFQNLQHEKRKIEIEIDQQAQLLNSEKTKLSDVITNKNKSLNRQIISFQMTFDNMKNEHKKSVDDLNNQIFQSREVLSNLRNMSFENEFEQIERKQQMVQNAIITKNRKDIENLLNTKREIERDRNQQVRKFELKLKELKNLYATKKCRPEEKKIIDRLRNILDMKNQELTSVFKDLASYRSHLQTQEELVNLRFGMAPKIGVAMIKPRSVSHLAPLVRH